MRWRLEQNASAGFAMGMALQSSRISSYPAPKGSVDWGVQSGHYQASQACFSDGVA
jgi:hypothetical protein